MVLVFAVVLGVAAGVVRTWLGSRRLQPPHLQLWVLVPFAFLPQLLAFRLPVALMQLSVEWAAAALISSQLALLVFVWVNRREAGFWLLGLGLAANLLVISLNGGLMPITPEMAARVWTDAPSDFIQVGHRLGSGKNIVRLAEQTRLWFLSDIFFATYWFPIYFRAVFSIGDVLIAFGSFWFFWAMGGKIAETNSS